MTSQPNVFSQLSASDTVKAFVTNIYNYEQSYQTLICSSETQTFKDVDKIYDSANFTKAYNDRNIAFQSNPDQIQVKDNAIVCPSTGTGGLPDACQSYTRTMILPGTLSDGTTAINSFFLRIRPSCISGGEFDVSYVTPTGSTMQRYDCEVFFTMDNFVGIVSDETILSVAISGSGFDSYTIDQVGLASTTCKPSQAPSESPSASPMQQTLERSAVPSQSPSAVPSTVTQPSAVPSTATLPSAAPSTSINPSAKPIVPTGSQNNKRNMRTMKMNKSMTMNAMFKKLMNGSMTNRNPGEGMRGRKGIKGTREP
jgi:hypothetical protein